MKNLRLFRFRKWQLVALVVLLLVGYLWRLATIREFPLSFPSDFPSAPIWNLRYGNRSVRQKTMSWLDRQPSNDVWHVQLRALREGLLDSPTDEFSSNSMYRIHAIQASARYAGESNHDYAPQSREAAVLAVPVFTELLRHPDGYTRSAAAEALGIIGQAHSAETIASVPPLIVALNDKAAQFAAAGALAKIGAPARVALPALRELTDSANKQLAEEARRAVAQLEEHKRASVGNGVAP